MRPPVSGRGRTRRTSPASSPRDRTGLPLHLLGELSQQAHRGSGPAERSEPAEFALRDAAGGEPVEQLGDGREEVAVVGPGRRRSACRNGRHRAGPPKDRRTKVVDRMGPTPSAASSRAIARPSAPCCAVHRGVGHDHARLALVAAQTVVNIHHPGISRCHIGGRASSRSSRRGACGPFAGPSAPGRRICPRCRRSSGAFRPSSGRYRPASR